MALIVEVWKMTLFPVTAWLSLASQAKYHQEHIDGLVQERRNSIANALELRLSCTNLSTWPIPGPCAPDTRSLREAMIHVTSHNVWVTGNTKYENFIAFCTDTLYIKTTCNKVTTDNTQQYIELN